MWPEFSVEDRFKGINRRVTISREELDFKCVWCHETESIQFATMNDKNIRIIKMSLAGKYPRHPLSGRPG
jgi:hypothetical protein